MVERTGIGAVMPSYNEIDGVPSHANKWLLKEMLRGEWGFDGAIVSDYAAIEELSTFHKVAANLGDASRLALEAGVDCDLPDGVAYRSLADEVRGGRVSLALVDAACAHMLRMKFRAGLFEAGPIDPAAAAKLTANDEARALALETARKAMVLLKNDGILPLTPGAHKRVAVIGPNAAVTRLGGYSSLPKTRISLLDGIRKRLEGKAEVVFAQGVFITQSEDRGANEILLADPAKNRALIKDAVTVARGADVVILAIGDTEQTSREGYARNHLGDRTDLDLVGEQNELFAAVKATGKPVIVMALNGRPPSWPTVVGGANALIECWYLGQEGGTAMAEALFGDINPGGKMPVTVVRDVGQIPFFYNHKPSAPARLSLRRSEPAFPLRLWPQLHQVRPSPRRASPPAKIARAELGRCRGRRHQRRPTRRRRGRAALCSRSGRLGRTAGQGAEGLPARYPRCPAKGRPSSFTLGPEAFRMWDIDMKEVVEPGLFDIMAGPNSTDLKSVTLEIV